MITQVARRLPRGNSSKCFAECESSRYASNGLRGLGENQYNHAIDQKTPYDCIAYLIPPKDLRARNVSEWRVRWEQEHETCVMTM